MVRVAYRGLEILSIPKNRLINSYGDFSVGKKIPNNANILDIIDCLFVREGCKEKEEERYNENSSWNLDSPN